MTILALLQLLVFYSLFTLFYLQHTLLIKQKVRQKVSLVTDNRYIKAFVGGGCSSIIAQMLSVPIDVVSQHMMLAGQTNGGANHQTVVQRPVVTTTPTTNPTLVETSSKMHSLERIHVPDSLKSASNIRVAKYISNEIYKNEKLRGFYRGYLLSTFLVSFNSALWWPFYYFYQGESISFMHSGRTSVKKFKK